jgi:hypothetical protein
MVTDELTAVVKVRATESHANGNPAEVGGDPDRASDHLDGGESR